MEKQEPKTKGRVPVQFWLDFDEKERADKVTTKYGELSQMARKGLMSQVAERERQIQEEQEANTAA